MYRRRPIYLVIDLSAGKLTETKRELKKCVDMMRIDPYALEFAAISIITFYGVVKQVLPLTDLMEFSLPDLKPDRYGSIDAVLDRLTGCVEIETHKTTHYEIGDFRPQAFLITDGESARKWTDSVAAYNKIQSINLVLISCDNDVVSSDAIPLTSLTNVFIGSFVERS